MKKIAIIHYLPIEFYPPIANLLDIICQEETLRVKVWTTHNNKKRNVYNNDGLIISRVRLPDTNSNGFLRFLRYFLFNFKGLIGLLLLRPSKIIYFETYSAWPVFVYKKFFNKSVKILVHSHEYFSPIWYEKGMRLVNYYHKLETCFLYREASWISHTNKDRMEMFLRDNMGIIKESICHILPNYPPKNWLNNNKEESVKPIKTVYIGSLSIQDTYLVEYCEWVISVNGEVVFDIYGYNYNKETLNYLNSINSAYINFNDAGIEYNEIPDLLEHYDVGLILYKAITENFKYNAPNKLFEYLVCNLQVWYSDKMLGIKPYDSSRVVSVDFESITDFDFDTVFKSRCSDKRDNHYTANKALKTLIYKLAK